MTEPLDDYDRILREIRWKKARDTVRYGAAKNKRRKSRKTYQPGAATAKALKKRRPFVGCDGEGGGTDANGAQLYRCLRIGDALLFRDNQPLSTVDCLEFILDQPKGPIFVGFAFCGYDATMILRDIPPKYVARLFEPDRLGYVHWKNYGLLYRQGHYLQVCRLYPQPDAPKDQGGKITPIKGSSRTIYETFGFFQSKFTTALKRWGIGDAAALERMDATKAQRGSFDLLTPELLAYNAQECRWLADMMEKFRDCCEACGIAPHSWNGAGKLAAALLKQHKTLKAARLAALVPQAALAMAMDAYYGGRAELGRPGPTEGSVYAYDLRSAYPAAMLELPCLECATWTELSGKQLAQLTEADTFVAHITYRHPKGSLWCGIPHRNSSGGLAWPRMGCGTYWSVEIFAAMRLGATIEFHKGWLIKTGCGHRPFGWLTPLYDYRRQLEQEQPGRGIPLKLAINSLYGKLAQRIGRPEYKNPVWAGLITAYTRARLIDAILSTQPGNIIALATDAVYSSVPLPLDTASELGNWEETVHPPMFFCLPGVYWEQGEGERLIKTRGMHRQDLMTNSDRLEAAWQVFLEPFKLRPAGQNIAYPKIKFPVPGFVSLRLAHARKAPEMAGKWTKGKEAMRALSMDWSNKRGGLRFGGRVLPGGGIQTWPQDGHPRTRSTSWTLMGAETLTQHQQYEFHYEGQPDGDDDQVRTELLMPVQEAA